MIRRPLLVCCLVATAFPVSGQEAASQGDAGRSDVGRPFVRGYRPVEVGGGNQNWAIAQDSRGVIYAGSQNGVLEFDGADWRLIRTPNLTTVRSLAIGPDGRIYAGSVGDFGYLAPGASGQLQFVSLLDRVPEEERVIADVWRTHVVAGGVIFQTERAIFRWANDTITVLRPVSRFNRASMVDGAVYLTMPESGLNRLDGDTFVPLPNTEELGLEVFPVILGYDERRLLIGTRQAGLFLYDGSALTPFATEVDAELRSHGAYRGTRLPDGTFVLTTTTGGMGIIDQQGRRVVWLDRAAGLPSDVVYYAAPDREGALWLGLDFGIARVDTPSPVSFFDEAEGYPGTFTLRRHEGRLYLAGQTGVYYLRDQPAPDGSRFVQIAGVRNQCWSFESTAATPGGRPPALAVACTDGLYEIRGSVAVPIHAPADGTNRTAILRRSTLDPTRIWIGLFDGITSYRYVDGMWIDEGRLQGSADQVRTLFENPDGSLWAGTSGTGLLRVNVATRPQAGMPRPATTVQRFGAEDGLAPGGVAVAGMAGTPRFLVGGDDPFVAVFDEPSRRFLPDPVFAGFDADPLRPSFGIVDGLDGRAYANFGRGTAVLHRQADGSWSVDRGTFGRFGRTPHGEVLEERGGLAWFGWEGRFVRFDLSRTVSAPSTFSTLVRRVTVGEDDVLFAGSGGAPSPPDLASTANSLRFEFAAPTFLDETATEYQSKLDGLDADWSAWSREARRNYTNLGFGEYRFRVRARNVVGQVGDEATYAFTILPPWYRTWWAYGLYLGFAVVTLAGAAGWQRHRVVAKERERAQLAEAKYRAEAAETLATSESERKKNLELIGEIGREITASLDFETIFERFYERVNQLADADVFGVGLYQPEKGQIEYRLAIEDGKRYAPYSRDTRDPNQFPVWCIEHRTPVFINDVAAEYSRYIERFEEQDRVLEDGSLAKTPQSLIYLPLLSKDRVLGVITIQSFEKHAYTGHHLNVMQSLAAFASIALDNANAYRQLNEQEHEIRRLFEEAEAARAVAEEADAAKSAFLSTVSHELRTPLTSVLGFAKIIKKRLEERIFPLIATDDRRVLQTMQQVEENLKVVVGEGERLTKLIDDVLDLAKIEAGKLEWHMDAVSLPDVIEHATAATSSLLDQKGLRLVVDLQDGLPDVKGDRDRLIQVVINLISNAVKFTDGGSVTCRAVRRDDDIVVSVIDTGVGIAPGDQPKVFERFKQVGDTLTDKPKGTGLGLPICREIVEHHGGRIWVESEPGRGSTFSFSLPAAHVARQAGPVDLAALVRQLRDHVVVTTPRTAEREPRILVVDDDPNIRELLTQEFIEAGYQVALAANGREALAEVRRHRPDLVVLDVMMPEMNGFDVAAVLRNDPETLDIPIVILSIVEDRERGFRLGVDRYLTKPIDTDLLFKEVGSLIEQQKSHKRVLVVDEDAPTVKTITEVLQTRGYSVSEARGEDLIERAKALQPDIIMLNSVSPNPETVRMLRFEKGLENVLFLVYR